MDSATPITTGNELVALFQNAGFTRTATLPSVGQTYPYRVYPVMFCQNGSVAPDGMAYATFTQQSSANCLYLFGAGSTKYAINQMDDWRIYDYVVEI